MAGSCYHVGSCLNTDRQFPFSIAALTMRPPMRISIIIPTLNEAARIEGAIARVRALGRCELIVADGGSGDGTRELAAGADLVLQARRGRAVQQNAGAAAAGGEMLLFLHADCWLEPGALEGIRMVLADPATVGGCFRQTIDAPGIAYRLLESGNAFRVRTIGLAYGDQGLFVRRDVFSELGGFPELPILEDLYFMKRLKRAGRFRLLPQRLHVSARRWERTGVVRQTLRNWRLIALAHCGMSPERLARQYADVR
jgi:rSAM/selenodomain-associated transferase 2